MAVAQGSRCQSGGGGERTYVEIRGKVWREASPLQVTAITSRAPKSAARPAMGLLVGPRERQ